MFTNLDRHISKTRSKKWDRLGFKYKTINSQSKKHSLNCGCRLCKSLTSYYKAKNKRERSQVKKEMKQTAVQANEYLKTCNEQMQIKNLFKVMDIIIIEDYLINWN
jgi:hypothetical protein